MSLARGAVASLLVTAETPVFGLGKMIVTADVLAELCRTWLAVDDAPTVGITACNQIAGASDFEWGDMSAAVQQWKPGRRVRLVVSAEGRDE